MQHTILKTIALILLLAVCLCIFPACQKENSLSQNAIASILLEKNQRVVATVTLDARTLQAHKGEEASLYELLPGENTADLVGREPIAVSNVTSTMTFAFALETEDHTYTRLYSTFVVGFADGSFLDVNGKRIENPQALAANTQSFAWASSPKGLVVDHADHAAEMGAMHAMLSLSLKEVCDGVDSFAFNGVEYSYSAAVIDALDPQILSATRAGLQISLTLIVDEDLTVAHIAAILDLLAARYAGGENGLLTAFFINPANNTNADDAALLCRLANQALLSRVANGRIYVVSNTVWLNDAKFFFSQLQRAIAATGAFEWGAAVSPMLWESDSAASDQSPLTLQTPSDFSSHLLSSSANGRPSSLAVTGICISAEDEDLQAAALAYAYRASAAAKAGLIYYAAHVDDACGLLSADGTSRRAAELFARLDTGLSAADQQLCATLLGDTWTSLAKNKETRTISTGAASIGSGGFAMHPLFDFTGAETHGFVGVGSASQPISRNSAYFHCPVLYTWLAPSYTNAAGIRKTLSDGSSLNGAMSISVNLLTQAPNASTCNIRLRLDGYAADGTLLTHTSQIEIENASWQTATFQIAPFIAEADLSKPCTLTLTSEPDTSVTEDYVLWVRYIDIRTPDKDMGAVWSVALITGGILLGFLGVFVLYHQTGNKRRKK